MTEGAPSLRAQANGARECTPDDRLRNPEMSKLDCFVASLLAMTRSRLLASPYHPFTGRLAWLACGTPRFSDMWGCVQSQPSAFPENTRVARPGRGNSLHRG